MKRRDLVVLLGGTSIAWPTTLHGQQPKPVRLGYIWIGAKGSEHSTRDGIRQGLRDLGYVEERDFVLEERYADSQLDRLPNIVAELVGLKVRLILSAGNQVTRAVMEGTSTIPIVATTPDLLGSGFVASLARPGGNVTGMSLTAGSTLGEKWVEILKEAFPNVVNVAVLANTTSASTAYMDRIRGAASSLGVQLQQFTAQDPEGVARALQAIAGLKPDSLIVESDAVLVSSRSQIIAFSAERQLPAIYGNLDYIPGGALMAYYTNIFEAWRRLATYVDRILKGAKPADLPVEQPTTFELVVNLKTAKALGLTIPPSFLARADEVIE
jgi:putative ABC transport system substrate-binding protein